MVSKHEQQQRRSVEAFTKEISISSPTWCLFISNPSPIDKYWADPMVFIITKMRINVDKIALQKGADKGSLRLIWSGESTLTFINEHWQGVLIIGFIIFWSLATLQSAAFGNCCPFWVCSFPSAPTASKPWKN